MAPVKKDHAPLGSTFIGAWREHVGKRQEDAAAAAGISRTLLSKLESGETPYTQRTLEALARVYKCRPADMLLMHPERRIADRAEAIALLSRLAIVPPGFAESAYAMISSAWGQGAGQPPQTPAHDRQSAASHPHESEPSR